MGGVNSTLLSIWVGSSLVIVFVCVQDVAILIRVTPWYIDADPTCVPQVSQPLADAIHEFIMSRLRERTDLTHHPLRPILDIPLPDR